MSEYEASTVLSNQQYNVVGTRPIRHDGTDKVTGRAQYSADIHLPGLLHARVLRSPHAHAQIKSIDTRRARNFPGVKAVITAADFAPASSTEEDQGFYFTCCNVMAKDKVLYKGHAVAAVAAVDIHTAAAALELIDVVYEVLPSVFNASEAMQPSAPTLHDNLPPPTLTVDEPWCYGPNVANHFVFALGDVDTGFTTAAYMVEKKISTVAVHQGYIEPHAATARWHDDGRLTIWASSQGHFSLREKTAKMIGLAVSQIKVIPMEIGGGFGAKLRFYVEAVAALLARQAGAPVKLAMQRHEVFEATGPTSGTQIQIKVGATKEGKLVAAQATLIYEAGAFPGSSVQGGARCMFSAYNIEHAQITGYDVVVNRPMTAAYRAPGTPPAAMAMETALDELAEKLNMDPLALRLLNSSCEGTRRITGPRLPRVGFIETLKAAKDHPHYTAKLKGPWRGRGVASGYWGNGSGPSSAIVTVNTDGTVNLLEGSPDIGGTRTSLAQQLAETLGIVVEAVQPQIADTDSIAFTSNSAGSGVTFKTGWAAYTAAQDVKVQMVERAAQLWEVEVDKVEYVDGVLYLQEDTTECLSFAQVASYQNETGGPIVGRAGVNPDGAGPALAVHIVDVEVDPQTGKVKILRYTAIQDAGKAIHPSYVEGQMQGGVAQGIGWALNEEYYINSVGHMQNATFLDYRMPTSLDLPMLDTVIVEVANPGHPYGVRGVGEVPIVPPAAALANAIYAATGIRFNELPMKPERILAGLAAKDCC